MRNTVQYFMFILVSLIAVPAAFGHCDSVSGPVIADARLAFSQGQVTPVLKWVRPADEADIKTAFARALAVRSKGVEAQELAEHYFFETLVRLHRASEGAPYTGLKSGATDPVIAAIDSSLSDGRDRITEDTLQHVRAELKARLNRTATALKDANSSVDAGREYVRAYVELVHFVEGLHGQAEAGAAEASMHQH